MNSHFISLKSSILLKESCMLFEQQSKTLNWLSQGGPHFVLVVPRLTG